MDSPDYKRDRKNIDSPNDFPGESKAALNSKIGLQEISFIKKDKDPSFLDSFFQEQEKLLEAEKHKAPRQSDQKLADGETDPALFNDIIEEEFDLDNIDEDDKPVEIEDSPSLPKVDSMLQV